LQQVKDRIISKLIDIVYYDGRFVMMIEQIFKLAKGNEKAIEKVVFDENIHYLHMVFNQNEGLPEHFSNSNVYMTVIRGTLSIGLNEQEVHEYASGTLLKIPFQTKMNVKNLHTDTLELIVVKAPAPKN
jgi:quercetin dioxygenase-like cupin family protein